MEKIEYSSRMIDRAVSCEVFLKEFYSPGSDEYLNHWAKEVDWMDAEGWKVIECYRQSEHPGFWTVVFGRARYGRSIRQN